MVIKGLIVTVDPEIKAVNLATEIFLFEDSVGKLKLTITTKLVCNYRFTYK